MRWRARSARFPVQYGGGCRLSLGQGAGQAAGSADAQSGDHMGGNPLCQTHSKMQYRRHVAARIETLNLLLPKEGAEAQARRKNVSSEDGNVFRTAILECLKALTDISDGFSVPDFFPEKPEQESKGMGPFAPPLSGLALRPAPRRAVRGGTRARACSARDSRADDPHARVLLCCCRAGLEAFKARLQKDEHELDVARGMYDQRDSDSSSDEYGTTRTAMTTIIDGSLSLECSATRVPACCQRTL